jgi:hypothetical protein
LNDATLATAMPAPRLPVVYAVGSSHSGSTLLALLGSQHPRVASVGETAVKPRIRREGRAARQRCSCGAELRRCPFWQAIFRRVTGSGLRFDETCWSNDYRFEAPMLDRLLTRETSSALLRQVRGLAAAHLPGYRRRFARIDAVNVAFIAAVLAETGASVFLDTTKLPTRLTHLLRIPALDVRVVWLTRDPRGVAYSARKRGLAIGDATEVWRHDQEAAARLLASLPPGRSLRIRYEDLCASPVAALATLWTFAGVEPIELTGAVRPTDRHVLGNSMRINNVVRIRADEAWRSGLTADEQARVLSMAGSLAGSLGYHLNV